MLVTGDLCQTASFEVVPLAGLQRKLRVCHVSISLDTGGLERVITELAKNHDRNRFELCFVPMKSEGRFADSIRQLGLRVEKLAGRSMVANWKTLSEFFRDQQIDIVHSHNTYPAIHATIAAKFAKVPIVINTRHGQRVGHGWKSRLQYRWACKYIDRVIAVSEDAAKLTIDKDRIRKEKVEFLWNGIDLNAFPFRGGRSESTIISVGRLVPEKDFETLLQATAIAKQSVPDLRLVIVGEGPLRADLQAVIDHLRARDYISLIGERSDVPELLATAGLYVSSSLSEGISLTILEAMAIGLPVVATAVGGNTEIIDSPSVGWTVEPGQPQKMAEVLRRAFGARADWPEIAARGRRRIETHFDARIMTRRYESLYHQLAIEKKLLQTS